MSLFSRLFNRAENKPSAKHAEPVRSIKAQSNIYSGSSVDAPNSTFLGDWRSTNQWLQFDLKRMRDRSRELERGNPWCQSFKASLINNVLGANGFHFAPKVMSGPAFGDASTDIPDVYANAVIASARKRFEKQSQFSTTKDLSRKDADRMILQRLAFDGEFLARKVPGFENDFRFSWQFIEPEYLDSNLNRIEPNGNIIRMGVELDAKWKFPVAYWFLTRRPNDNLISYSAIPQNYYERVEAKDIIHVFLKESPEQTRGVPWVFAAILNLHNIGNFEESALINARVGASKMGFFKKTTPDGWSGTTDASGDIIDEVAPGSFTELPVGVELQSFDPTYPNNEFEGFNRAMLRSISASLKIGYMTLTGDMSQANFSSLRAGLNEEREQWMQLQAFLIEKWKEPEFEEWLFRALVSRVVPLPLAKFDKFNAPRFTGRRWSAVNPLQDEQTNQMRLDNCTTSISEIIRETGRDPEAVWAEISEDQKRMDALGIARIRSAFQVVDLESEANSSLPPAKPNPNAPANEHAQAVV